MRRMSMLVGTMLALSTACSDASVRAAKPEAIASDFAVAYSPVYSAFDGEHEFRFSLVAADSQIEADTWQVVDEDGRVLDDAADIEVDERGAATLTTRKAGDFIVLAHSADQTGCTELHVTANTPEQVQAGEERYSQPIELGMLPKEVASGTSLPEVISCKSCHGMGAMYLSIEHTPLQTAGISDLQLGEMLSMGAKPNAGEDAVRCTPYPNQISKVGVPLAIYRYFHSWNASTEEIANLVAYLRSLPLASAGALDLAGVRLP